MGASKMEDLTRERTARRATVCVHSDTKPEFCGGLLKTYYIAALPMQLESMLATKCARSPCVGLQCIASCELIADAMLRIKDDTHKARTIPPRVELCPSTSDFIPFD